MKLHPTTNLIRLSAYERSELMTIKNISNLYANHGIISADSYTITLPQHEVLRYLETMGLTIANGFQQYWHLTPEFMAGMSDYEPITIVVRKFNSNLLTMPLLNAVIIGA